MEPVSAILMTVAGILGGGVGVKIVEHLFMRGKVKEDIASELRKELREDLINYRKAATEAEDREDKLRAQYYQLLEENAALKAANALVQYKTEKVARVVKEHVPEADLKDVLDLPE